MNEYVIKGLKSSQDLGLVILPLDRNVPSPFFCLFFLSHVNFQNERREYQSVIHFGNAI